VLVIEGKSLKEQDEEKRLSWQEMSIEEHMKFYEDAGVPHKDAMKKVAADRGVGKREIYKALLEND
jgi:16S rRNA (cytidine1402-2'-O)-methyltransferase